MKIWLYINNQQMGPFELEQVREMHIGEQTPVWYEGLSDWMPAGQAPLTAVWYQQQQTTQDEVERELREREQRAQQQETQRQCGQEQEPEYRQQQAASVPTEEVPPCPKNYMVWSILITVCCCQIAGIIAIIYAAQVNDRYRNGNYRGAEDASEKAQWWIIIGFTLGLVTMPLSFLSMLGG